MFTLGIRMAIMAPASSDYVQTKGRSIGTRIWGKGQPSQILQISSYISLAVTDESPPLNQSQITETRIL